MLNLYPRHQLQLQASSVDENDAADADEGYIAIYGYGIAVVCVTIFVFCALVSTVPDVPVRGLAAGEGDNGRRRCGGSRPCRSRLMIVMSCRQCNQLISAAMYIYAFVYYETEIERGRAAVYVRL
ncbi:unnamed protein product [Urochloa humidicola]